MKQLDYKLGIIIFLILIIVIQFIRGQKEIVVEKIVEVKVEVPVEIHDTIPFEVKVPYFVDVPYEVEKLVIIHDTIFVEKIVKVPFDVITSVDTIVEIEQPKVSQWYLGFGYDFGINPVFGGASTKLLYKTKSDKMFGLDLGVRNHITNFETMEGRIKPYIGGSLFIKIK